MKFDGCRSPVSAPSRYIPSLHPPHSHVDKYCGIQWRDSDVSPAGNISFTELVHLGRSSHVGSLEALLLYVHHGALVATMAAYGGETNRPGLHNMLAKAQPRGRCVGQDDLPNSHLHTVA